MENQELSAGSILKTAWQRFKDNWIKLIGVFLIIMLIQTALSLIAGIGSEGFAKFVNILSYAAGIIMGMGFININIKVARDENFEIADLFGTTSPFFKYLGGGLLYAIICTIGFILLIVPGIIWGIKFCLFPYFIVDQNMGPIEALEASSRATQGQKSSLFGIFIIFFGVAILGLILLIVGIIPSSLTLGIAHAIIYLSLSESIQEPGSAEAEFQESM